jgi:signal transduction histidine kinase
MVGPIPAGSSCGEATHPAAEAAGAFLASAALFLAAASISSIGDHFVLVVALGCAYVYVVVLCARRLGPAYSVPLAIAGGVAFDWFYIPPTHTLGSDSWENWLAILVYISMGILVGMLAAGFRHRAQESEQSRDLLLDEQAALRRVATLVARESPPAEVFMAVAGELARLLGVEDTRMLRYEDDGTATVVADRGGRGTAVLPVGTRVRLDGDSVAARVYRTQRPARVDDLAHATGSIVEEVRAVGIRSAAGGPIVVEGKLWGAIVASTLDPHALPADTELRIGQFTELVATAISNVEARTDLAASRARIIAAADDERRRVVRDLHDGAQQRLVHTVVTLKLARRALENGHDGVTKLVNEALEQAESAMVELRELAHGILPSALNRGGLRAGVEALASRTPVPVEIGVGADRFPAPVEATAYFVVAEALTNVAKHANAERATVTADVDNGALRIEIADDGTGTADPNGHGLLGLADRLASTDGTLQVLSAPGSGTRVLATVPLPR